MTRKILGLSNPGTSTLFGSEDLDYVNKLLTGEDQSLADPVTINTLTTFGSEKLCVAGTAGFKYIFRGKAILADRYVDLPLMGDDGEIALANTTSANDWGTNVQTFRHQNIVVRNPANTKSYIINSSAIIADRNATLPLLTEDDIFCFLKNTQNLENKTLVSPILSGVFKTTNLGIVEDDTNFIGIRNAANNAYKHLRCDHLQLAMIESKDATKIDINSPLIIQDVAEIQRNTAPVGNAPLGYVYLYVDDSDGALKTKDSSGNILVLGSGGGGGGGSSGSNFYDELTINGFKYGLWTGESDESGYGLFGKLDAIGGLTSAYYIDSSSGLTGRTWNMTGSSDEGGIRNLSTITMRKLDPDLEVCFQLTEDTDKLDSRLWIGFAGDVTESTENSSFLENDIGFMLAKRSDESFYKIIRNDGDATQDESASILTADGAVHRIRLVADNTNTRFGYSLDGAALTYFNTEIPSTTDPLGVIVTSSQNDTVARSFRIFWAKLKMKERA